MPERGDLCNWCDGTGEIKTPTDCGFFYSSCTNCDGRGLYRPKPEPKPRELSIEGSPHERAMTAAINAVEKALDPVPVERIELPTSE